MARAKQKEKIAISIDRGLLAAVDARIDGSVIKSRSGAIEALLGQGLRDSGITKAVLLLKSGHIPVALKEIDGKPLVERQAEFFSRNGILRLYVLTQPSKKAAELRGILRNAPLHAEVLEQNVKGSALALKAVQENLSGSSFIVMDGDTLMDFGLARMMQKHLESGRIATMGLVNSPIAERYTSVSLDGDSVRRLDRKKHSVSRIIDAGIYIFSPRIFDFISARTASLVADVLPAVAAKQEMQGFFIFGQYMHMAEM